MKLPKIILQPVFEVSIFYKSGQVLTMEFTEFKITNGYGGSTTYTWTEASPGQSILQLGVDDVVAVAQTGFRRRLRVVFE